MTPAEIPKDDARTLREASFTSLGKKTMAAPTAVEAPAAITAPNAIPTLLLCVSTMMTFVDDAFVVDDFVVMTSMSVSYVFKHFEFAVCVHNLFRLIDRRSARTVL